MYRITNLKAAIIRACWYEPQAQRAYRECAEHYDFLISPCRPKSPQHKGKVEKGGVHYVKRNFLAGREPGDLIKVNREVIEWIMNTAGIRIHGTTKERPLERFDKEKKKLRKLPTAPYDMAVWKELKVGRDCYVHFDNAHYSVPFRLVGQKVQVRGGCDIVQIYNSRLLEDEVERRGQNDFFFNPSLNRQQILDLATCNYIHSKRNMLICGPSGVGKTHLAQALTHEACRQGYTALFVNTYRMLQHLNGGRATNSFERRLQTYLRPDLLVLDDFGLKALQDPAPEDLYDVINERYERGSILLTSNRPPEEWPELFGNPLLASAGLDRLTHGATMVVITGKSFRAHGLSIDNDEKKSSYAG